MSSITDHRFAELRLRLIAALAALALNSCASAGNEVVARESSVDVRARVVELVNAARSKSRKCGSERFSAAPPLIASPELNEAAARHARDMARSDYFDHRGADGSQPKDRVLRAGYQSRLTGENIALGPESAEEVVAGWLASPDIARTSWTRGSSTSALAWPPAVGAARSTGCRISPSPCLHRNARQLLQDSTGAPRNRARDRPRACSAARDESRAHAPV